MEAGSIVKDAQPGSRGQPMTALQPASGPKPPRDQRLDAFRGLGMLIIFIAHAPGNPWNNWIPARFGFSSATELFVFCSGLASAMAFGSTFAKRGWLLGTARTLYRAWQVYWAHLGLFIALAALAIVVRDLTGSMAYYDEHIAPIAADPATALLGLVTLHWLPGYLDILPMYLVILGLIPVMMLARQQHPALPFVLAGALYLAVWLFGLTLIGNPWTGFGWFFNPFAWQLIFFAGFAIGMGWIAVPALCQRGLLIASASFVILSMPLSFWGVLNHMPALASFRDLVLFGQEKTDLHVLRIVHFAATAYLVLSAVAHWRIRLDGVIGRHVIKVGQQSLASFLLSLVVARIAGVGFEMSGGDALAAAVINLAGLALVVAGAHLVGWFKSAPWSGPRRTGSLPASLPPNLTHQ
jgi:hypothetical protein